MRLLLLLSAGLRFHAGLTGPVSNALHKTLCLAGMCSTGNTQRQGHDLPELSAAIGPIFDL